jgi:hypothetical protein
VCLGFPRRKGTHCASALTNCSKKGALKRDCLMSALPPKAFAVHSRMSALCQKRTLGYSITSSARDSSDGGIVIPSAFAVLLLMTSSNRVA